MKNIHTDKGYSFYSLSEILKKIDKNEWILPSWQRDYVWKKDNIEFLFDSLLKKYPIGNILLWETKPVENSFCNFINEANYFNNVNVTEPSKVIKRIHKNKVTAVLDGQQRLTSLYLSLSKNGRIIMKNKDRTLSNRLYLLFNVIYNKNKKENNDWIFWVGRDDQEGYFENCTSLFFRVDKIISDNYKELFDDFIEEYEVYDKDKKIAKDNVKRLQKVLSDIRLCFRIINNEPKSAFDIFHRLNSSGQNLSPSQLSTCKLIYTNDKLKHRIHADLARINGNDFEFDVSYIVNLLYILQYGKLKEKNSGNDDNIIKQYDNAIKYTKYISIILRDELDLGHKIITSYNAILPMTFYLFKNKLNSNVSNAEKEAIKYFMFVSMIKGLFGGSSKDTINKSIKEMKAIKKRGLSIKNTRKMNIKKNINNNFVVNQDIIDGWLTRYKKGDGTTKLLLYILYKDYNFNNYDYEEDHLQPDSEFRVNKKIYSKQKQKVQIRWTEMKDQIPNLQLLKDKKNRKKTNESLKDWLIRNPEYKSKNNYFPLNVKNNNGKIVDVTLLENFDYLFRERKKLIEAKLCSVFGVKYKNIVK